MSFNARKILQPLSYPIPIEWIYPPAQLPALADWKVIFAAGKFVAVSKKIYSSINAVPAYSYDGINWNQGNVIGGIMDSHCVAYGNGIFIALGPQPAYSSDGITWNLFSGPDSYDIIFGGGKFLASGKLVGKILYSVNGTSWTTVSLPNQYFYAKGMAYGNGRFVITPDWESDTSNYTAYSNDGITWYSSTLPYVSYWSSVVYVNGKFVAVSKWSKSAISEDGGVTWRDYGLIYNTSGIMSMIAVQDLLVTISRDNHYAQKSNSKLFWYTITAALGRCTSIAYGNNRYVIVGSDESTALYSK